MTTVLGQGNDALMAQNKIKGMYLYQFAKNINWSMDHKSGDFIIGVYGDDNIYKQLQDSYTGKLIGNQPIKIVRYYNQNDCHILYVSRSKSELVESLSKKLNKSRTLIVANKTGMLSSGATINFVINDNTQNYEINKTSAVKSNLTIGQLLIKGAANIL